MKIKKQGVGEIKIVLNMRVDNASYKSTTERILELASENIGAYICVANVHMCMEAYDSLAFQKIVNEADMVVPDGRPLVWALKASGAEGVSQVRGSDLLLKMCKDAEEKNISVGFYGGSNESLADFLKFITKRFMTLKIPFYSSPPFRELTEKEDADYIDKINASGVTILFVGIGCPKQEKWMAAHKKSLSCVMIGVGAAFDFFSGRKKHAPRWMQQVGLEWFFRLCSEPVRLWKRYLKQNPRFIWYFLRQWIDVRTIMKAQKTNEKTRKKKI